MALTVEEKKAKQREYNRQYYLAHRERKLEQNARSGKRWRETYPERYKAVQRRSKARQPLQECTACGEMRPHNARGMCVRCYGQWRYRRRKAQREQAGA